MKKQNIDQEFIHFINEMFNFNDKKAAELVSKELIKVNATSKRSTSKNTNSIDSIDSAESFFNALIKFNRVSIDTMTPTSIDKLLNIYYKINHSFLMEDQNKKMLALVKSYSKGKNIYHAKSFLEMGKLINLFESYGGNIISSWIIEDKKGEMKPRDTLVFATHFERLFKIYSAICALKEIAYVRSKINDQFDFQLIFSIVKIVLYSYGQLSKAGNIFMKPAIHDVIVSAKGQENIEMRWEPINKLKEEAAELANKLWSEGDTGYHNEVAKEIYAIQLLSNPEIRGTMEFTEADFNNKNHSVSKLCQAISKDKYDLHLKYPDNTIERLNEILKTPDLFEVLDEKYIEDKLPPDVKALVGITRDNRSIKRLALLDNNKDRENILKLNRMLLEIIYPNETPKRPKKDLSKFYSVKVVREAIGDIADKYGRKRGSRRNK